MFLRVRYFPVIFLALVVALILLIPYYYSENWRLVQPQKGVAAEDGEAEVTSATLQATTRWIVPEVPQSANEIDERPFAQVGNETIVPQAAPPVQRRIGVADADHFRFPPLSGNVAEFALQMARDRLEIERYGVIPLSRRHNGALAEGATVDEDDGGGSSENGTEPQLQVLIVTYFRGGTTFFGDLLNQYPGTYYHFEPLHLLTLNDQVAGASRVAEALHVLRRLLRCDYGALPRYIDWVRRNDNRFLLEHNHRLWLGCHIHPALCFDAHFLSAMCRLHPIHVFKLVRLRLAHARHLLDEFPQLRLIYLVRDPRGLYSSRKDLAWCNGTRSCVDPTSYCEDMRQDLATALRMRRAYPDRFLAVRYEDVALDPKRETRRVLDFLRLTFNAKMSHFIQTHTQPRLGEDLGGPYSTKRNSKKVAFSWRRKLTPQEVDAVESVCSDVIKQLALP